MPKKKIDYKNIELPLRSWNATTFKSYIAHLNIERFGNPCIHGYPLSENKQISDMCKEYGKEVVKEFVRQAVMKYKSSDTYPTVNWTFMFTYQKQYILPSILNSVSQDEPKIMDEEEIEKIKNLF